MPSALSSSTPSKSLSIHQILQPLTFDSHTRDQIVLAFPPTTQKRKWYPKTQASHGEMSSHLRHPELET
jgi:hypothetical protein